MDILPPLNLLHVLEFSKQNAQKAAELEIEMEKKEKKVLETTLIIAAIVINRGANICSLNKDFKELKNVGLKLFL